MAVKTCKCGEFEFGTYDPETEEDNTYSTECGATTTKVFAMGHDAKLVGFLVRAELAGDEISLTEGGMRVTFGGAVSAARTISDALAVKALAQLQAREDKIRKAAVKRLTKAELAQIAKQAAVNPALQAKVTPEPVVEPTTRDARIKVGRWTYDAVIDLPTGEAHFFSKLGQAKTAQAGEYSEV